MFSWNDISALVANRLIALDKCPGVHPIGIGGTLRCVVGKAVCYATRVDVELAYGSDQLCGGVRSGTEGAIHAMTSLFLQHGATSGWGVSYRRNYRQDILSANYRHIVYKIIIGKFQLIAANVT